MTRPLTVFCGKGGVGKTTLSLAFALWHADQGRRVLVVTSHPLEELAISVSLAGLEQQPLAAANLFLIHIEPRDVLATTVRQVVPSALLAEAVLSSRIYQSLIEVVPALKEVAFVARLRELAEHGEQAGRRFDLLVWDAPATGHFLRTLEVSRNFDAYLSGPMALLGQDLLDFFSDPAALALWPVAILEEMAVEESIELLQKLAGQLKIRPAGILCNMASPLLGSPDALFDELRRESASEPSGAELKFVLERHAIERGLFRKLQSAAGSASGIVRRVSGYSSDLELLRGLGRQVGPLLGASNP